MTWKFYNHNENSLTTKQLRTQNEWMNEWILIGMEPHAEFSLSNFLDNQLFGKN